MGEKPIELLPDSEWIVTLDLDPPLKPEHVLCTPSHNIHTYYTTIVNWIEKGQIKLSITNTDTSYGPDNHIKCILPWCLIPNAEHIYKNTDWQQIGQRL